jgi:plastocyanin
VKKEILVAIVLFLIVGTVGVIKFQKAKASSVVNITLYGSFSGGWGYTPSSITSPGPTITVSQGDTVNMTLISQDGITHRFYVDYNKNRVPDDGEPDSGNFNPSTTLQFVANTNGTFTYYCYIHPSTMFGTFTVTSPIPEFSSSLILPLLMMGTLSAIAIFKYSRRLSKRAL